MEIKVKSHYTLDSFKAFVRASTFKKFNPVKCLVAFAVIWFLGVAVSIADLILIGDSTFILILILLALAAFIWLYMYFGFPILMYKSQQQLQNAEAEFTFRDNEILIYATNGLASDNSVVSYLAVTKVMETSEYFFIFISKSNAYIVDKSGLSDESIESIRAKLSSVQTVKYILCRY